jgi:precorrin-6B methylase 2
MLSREKWVKDIGWFGGWFGIKALSPGYQTNVIHVIAYVERRDEKVVIIRKNIKTWGYRSIQITCTNLHPQ